MPKFIPLACRRTPIKKHIRIVIEHYNVFRIGYCTVIEHYTSYLIVTLYAKSLSHYQKFNHWRVSCWPAPRKFIGFGEVFHVVSCKMYGFWGTVLSGRLDNCTGGTIRFSTHSAHTKPSTFYKANNISAYQIRQKFPAPSAPDQNVLFKFINVLFKNQKYTI